MGSHGSSFYVPQRSRFRVIARASHRLLPVRLGYRHCQVIPKVSPIIEHPNFLDIACALKADILRGCSSSFERLFAERPLAGGHEDHIIRH